MIARFNKVMVLAGIISLACFISFAAAETQGAITQPQEAKKQEFKQKKQEAVDNFAKELELTPEQEAQIKAQREQQKKENQAIREELKAKNQELRQELDKATIDEARVNGLVSQITALEGRKLSQHVSGVISMKKILTPEQEAKLKAKRDQIHKNMQHKSGMMRERIKEKFGSK